MWMHPSKVITAFVISAFLWNVPAYAEVFDADLDGVVDTVDIDDDNDGIPDFAEITATGADRDSDGDGMPDRLDLDSDNDGILDLAESGVFMLAAYPSVRVVGGRLRTAVGLNGYSDFLENPIDSGQMVYELLNLDSVDGDIMPDYLDLDSDNDGLLDLWEAGIPADLDIDRNGRIDANPGEVGADGILDSVQTNKDTTCCDYDRDGVEETTPRNTDGGDLPDFQDIDSDNDGVYDIVEAGGRDANGDGRIDGFQDDPSNPDGVDDAILIIPLTPTDDNQNGTPDVLEFAVQHTATSSGPVVITPPVQETLSVTDTDSSGANNPELESHAPLEQQDQSPAQALPADDAGEPDSAILTGLDGGSGCIISGNTDLFFPFLVLIAGLWIGLKPGRSCLVRRSPGIAR